MTELDIPITIRLWLNKDRRYSSDWSIQETLPSYLFLKGCNELEDKRLSYAVLVGSVVVGRMMLRDFRYAAGKSARLGTYFGPSHRVGLGREAYRLFLSTIPTILGLDTVYGDIHEENVLALNLSRKSGFISYGDEVRIAPDGSRHRFILVRYTVL